MKSLKILTILFVIGLLSFVGTAQADLNDGLVAYYPFNGNAKDESGNGNDATVYGAALVEDRFGKIDGAYSFDGNDSVRTDIIVTHDQSAPQTVSGWFKTTDLNNVEWDGRIFGFESRTRFYMGILEGKLRYAYGSSDGYVDGDASDKMVNDGEWHHFVYISNGNNKTAFVYLDGLLVKEFTAGVNPSLNTGYIYMGGDMWKERSYTGQIDDIRLYERVLSESEIQQLYNEGDNINITDIVDSDNDGVPDIWDTCPNTPVNAFTNKQGCSAVQLGQTPDGSYDEGKQYCIDNPEACGWTAGGGYSQSDLDTADQNGYDRGYQAGVNVSCDDPTTTPSDGNCAVLESNFNITMPCIDVFGTNFSIGLERFTNKEDPFGYYWKLNLQ